MKITGYGFAKEIYQDTTYPIGYFCMASDGQTHQDVRIFCTIYIVISYLFIFILLWSTILFLRPYIFFLRKRCAKRFNDYGKKSL